MSDRIIDFNEIKNKVKDKDVDKFEEYIYSMYYKMAEGKLNMADFSKNIMSYMEENNISQDKLMNIQKKFLERYGTKLEAWAPFARGSQGIFENEVLMQIAKQHNKTIGQVALRFLIQNGIIAIPKSTHKNRMEENFNIFDFSLSDEEMKKIEELDLGENVFMNHENAEDIDKFFKMFHVGQK